MRRGKKANKDGVLIASSQPCTSSARKMSAGFSDDNLTEPRMAEASKGSADVFNQKLNVSGLTDTNSPDPAASQSSEGHPAEWVADKDASASGSQRHLSNDRAKRISGAQRRKRNRERNSVLGEDGEKSLAPLASDFIERLSSPSDQRAGKAEDNISIFSESTQISFGRSVSTLKGENDYEVVSRLQSEEPSDLDVAPVQAAEQNHLSSQDLRMAGDVPGASDIATPQTDDSALHESPLAAQTEPHNQLHDSLDIKDVMLEGQRLSRKLKSTTERIEQRSIARTQAYEQIRAAHDEIARLTRLVAAETAAIEREENQRKIDRASLHRAHQILGLD
jgi:hypothetical protein